MTITGTNHFVNTRAALKYYKAQGYENVDEAVLEKVRAGEIVLGIKPALKPGQKLIVIDNGTRYAIEE